MIPSKDKLTIGFAHVAYQLGNQFQRRNRGIKHFQCWNREELERRVGEADVLCLSGLWRNDLLPHAKKLTFIQAASAGTDQFSRPEISGRGIRLASARGANARCVAEHAITLILALSRRLPEARDNQAKRFWRGMISDLTTREDELGGKTVALVGIGAIGGRFAQLAKAFDMRVMAFRRDPAQGKGVADSVHPISELKARLGEADFVVLCCPLTKETENLIGADALGRMKPSAFLINVARGRCVDETAVAKALADGRIAGAGIDVTVEEPLADSSPLWALPNALITPHTAGETRRYEDNVLDILEDNLERLWRGETALKNEII